MRISDWSSDVCSSDLALAACNSSSRTTATEEKNGATRAPRVDAANVGQMLVYRDPECGCCEAWADIARKAGYQVVVENRADMAAVKARYDVPGRLASCHTAVIGGYARSEEHTSELQSLMRHSYAVFCLKKKK